MGWETRFLIKEAWRPPLAKMVEKIVALQHGIPGVASSLPITLTEKKCRIDNWKRKRLLLVGPSRE